MTAWLLVIATMLVLVLAFATTYNWTLAMLSYLLPSHDVDAASRNDTKFIILIPAHNEENYIARTITTCLQQAYPSDQYQVVVVADNCSDNTATVASEAGARCLIRNVASLPGKGCALSWAFLQLSNSVWDAVVVLDADCVIDSKALMTFNKYLKAGHRVLQARNETGNPDASTTSYAAAVGNFIENNWFYGAREKLGLPIMLRGTGMVLSRSILREHPWTAGSNVEDTEYSMGLILAGAMVKYVSDVTVHSAAPVRSGQMDVQRRRWVGGNFSVACGHALPLIAAAAHQRRPAFVETVFAAFVGMKSLYLSVIIGVMIANSLLGLFVRGPWSLVLFQLTVILLTSNIIYFLAAIVAFGLTKRRLKLLVGVPFAVLRHLVVATSSVIESPQAAWVRTPREEL